MSKLKDKSIANAKHIEQARACQPAENYITRFKRAFGGPSNSGTVKGKLKGY